MSNRSVLDDFDVNNMDITYELALPGRKNVKGALTLRNVPQDAEISAKDLKTIIGERTGIPPNRIEFSNVGHKSYLAHDIATKIIYGSVLQEKTKAQIHSELQFIEGRIRATLRMVEDLEHKRTILQSELSETVVGGRRMRAYRR